METQKRSNLKKTGAAAVFWILLTVLIISGSTYAWFTFNSATRITPMAGTIGSDGAELLISNAENGLFGRECELPSNGTADQMQPVSTADLESWFAAEAQNSAGISNRFKNITDTVDERRLYGAVYLKMESGSGDIYLDGSAFRVSGNEQMLAAGRMGMTVTSSTGETVKHIFLLDSFGSDGAESKRTVSEENTVISSVDASGNAEFVQDPAEEPGIYYAVINGENVLPGAKLLIHLSEGETARVDYCLYIEGCDENAVNACQDKDISLSLGFACVGK